VSTYVLVHGAFHGAWCWKRVAPLLRGAGHEVFTPTLTGLGERVHLASPEIGLETHILDVVNLMRFEDLSDVILVGHSYSGMVVEGAADRAPERVANVVYLDAFIPQDGQSLADYVGHDWLQWHRSRAAAAEEPWRLPPREAAYFGVTDPDDQRWVDSLMVGQPIRTFEDKLRLTNPAARRLPHTYIMCTREDDSFEKCAAIAHEKGWRYFGVATGHDAMVTAPRELADILLQLAR
jgi:pimeloyl-ACP methyl ester carboxylesterase